MALEALAGLFEGCAAVEQSEKEAFFVAEADEVERDGVVDDPVAVGGGTVGGDD